MGITTISGGKASKGGATSADKVSYNNTESGLQATTVQGAIDEVGANLGEIETDVNALKDASEVIYNSAENVAYKTTNVETALNTNDADIKGSSSTINVSSFSISTIDNIVSIGKDIIATNNYILLLIHLKSNTAGTIFVNCWDGNTKKASDLNFNLAQSNTYNDYVLKLSPLTIGDKINKIGLRSASGNRVIDGTITIYSDNGIENELSSINSKIVNLSSKDRIIDSNMFEYGNISISTSGWNYSDSFTRIRTKNGFSLSLKRGDIIHFSSYSDLRYYLGWRTQSGAYKLKGWNTDDYQVTEDAEFCILICNVAEKGILYPNELISRLSIIKVDNENEISYFKGINHRGYNTIAPENTLSAYKLSKKKGFQIVETDVNFTSDGVPVLLHDDTIDRTSNGSGAISDMTFAQARTYDFGSWKSSEYAGEKIPSLEEFIALCRNYNLYAYIELKGNFTQQQAEKVIKIVEGYGMISNVTFISFYKDALDKIHTLKPNIRLGLVYASAVTQSVINNALSLKGDNEIFIDCSVYDSDSISLCKANGVPLEIWTLNNETTIKSLDSYISGVTSDSVNCANIFKD